MYINKRSGTTSTASFVATQPKKTGKSKVKVWYSRINQCLSLFFRNFANKIILYDKENSINNSCFS